jgi:hypothetical protein
MNNFLDLYNSREGTSQRTRLDENLLPENFSIDGRSAIDLVKFAIEFSKSLNYYNVDNSVTQSWKDFFIKDRIIFLYIIANTNLYQVQKAFYQGYEFTTNLTDTGDILAHLHTLITPFHETLDLLASWNDNLEFSDLANGDLLSIHLILRKEDILAGIRRACQISRHLGLNIDWESVDRNFSLHLPAKTVYSYDESDPGLIKSTFEEIYLLSERIIENAKDKVSGKTSTDQDVRPHIALFLGFLKIYEILQGRMNDITRKHLDYYYEEVLNLSPHGMIPDEAFVRFELNAGYHSYNLASGTCLIAGKDQAGEPIVYQTLHETQLSRTKIAGLHTYFISRNPLNYTGLGEKPVISDIFYRKHDPAMISAMKIFGEDQFFKASSERSMDTAGVGFIIASDHLMLSEGERQINIDIEATETSYQSFNEMIRLIDRNEMAEKSNFNYTFHQVFSTAMDLYIVIDGEENRYERFKVTDNPGIHGISLEISVSAEESPVNALKSNSFKNQPAVGTPYVKVLLREESHIYAYSLLQTLDVVNIRLRTQVVGMKNFILYNNYGLIDQSVPFQVFGAIPKVHSYFMLGSPELYGKAVYKTDVEISWYQLPSGPDGWTGYFADYEENILNSDYKVEIEYLNAGSWKKLKPRSVFPLFEEEENDSTPLLKLSGKTGFHGLELPIDDTATQDAGPFQPYHPKIRGGYLKFELINPEFGFGYDAYNKNLFKTISKNAKATGNENIKQPNQPVSPVVKSISVNYYAETAVISEKGAGNSIRLYSIGPAGYLHQELKSGEKPVKLLLDFEPEGHLLIGLDTYPAEGDISFYFKTLASNVESYIRDVPHPKWQYLVNDHWVDMPPHAVLFDNTMGFVQSGIINMKIPPAITNNNTLTSEGLYWIKASIDKNSHIVPDVTGIYTNVARVRWDGKSDGSHITMKLPDNRISKLKKLDPKISKVEQVSDTFYGSPEELKSNYYVRVSERIRHKNRATTNWDYERLVLEKFPFVFKVKCFNAISYSKENQSSENIIEPGNMMLVVTPDVTSPFITDKLQPKFGINILVRIRDYLQTLSSPFVKIGVRNPYYELIQVICKVKIKGNLNQGHYIARLNQDLINHLTPWVQNGDSDEQFGGSLFRSKIMAFVNQREYIDFVTSFSIVKINAGPEKYILYDSAGNEENNEVIGPEFPWSVLTSVQLHDITAIDDTKYCAPVPRGINNMKLGFDFILKD